MATKPRLSQQQAKIVKVKVESELKGIPQRVFAPSLYPNADPKSAEVLVSRELNKVNVRQAVEEALDKHGITIEKATKPIADGLEAINEYYDSKGKQHVRPDHSTRLKASGMALKLMVPDRDEPKGNTFIFNNGDVVKKKYVKD